MENAGLIAWLLTKKKLLYETQLAAPWQPLCVNAHQKIYVKDIGDYTFVLNTYKNKTGDWNVRLFKGTKHGTDSWHFLENEKDVIEEYEVSGKLTKTVLQSLFKRADEALQKLTL